MSIQRQSLKRYVQGIRKSQVCTLRNYAHYISKHYAAKNHCRGLAQVTWKSSVKHLTQSPQATCKELLLTHSRTHSLTLHPVLSS